MPRLALGFLCCALMLLVTTAAADGKEQKLKQLQSRIKVLQQGLNENQGKKQHLDDRLKNSELEISQLTRSLRVLDDRLSRKRKRLKELRQQESSQLSLLKSQQEILVQQIRAAFLMGRQERIKLLFNQQDPDKVSRMIVYYDYINQERVRRLKQIEARIKVLKEIQLSIEKEELKIHDMQQTQLVERQQLQQTQVTRKQVINDISKELAQGNKALKQLRHDETKLGSFLVGVQKAVEEAKTDIVKEESNKQTDKPFSKQANEQIRLQTFKSRKGAMPWPSKGRITASFGTTRIGSLRWQGMMISAPEGNEVRAVHGGQVVYADWLRGFGLLVIVDHGQGYMTLYGHNQTIFKEPGDWVEAGEQIALVGSSGGQDHSGVYFAIRRNGKPINPAKWCKRPRGRRVG